LKNEKIQKQQLLQELEELLARLSIPLRYEKGDFSGGLCRIEEQAHFILNKNLSLEQKLQILKNDIQQIDLEDHFIRPALREFLNS
jgi:hypothetical protein